ncbi:MAG TPA: alpha-L-rhamnosidase C-terminal domain-containing protein [Ruminiclostridium sp.]
MKPKLHENMLKLRILPFLRGEKLQEAIPSAYWTSYVLTVVREKGYERDAIDFIYRMWEPMTPFSTTAEVFDTDTPLTTKVEVFNTQRGFTSLSHAWSAHPLFHLLNILGGVVQDSIAWERIIYKPYFDVNLSKVNIKMPCPQGIIESSWERKDNGISVRLKLPQGVRAKISIPGHETEVEGSFECIFIERNT